jgi:NADH:ubiquinone oxidoreductase subunit K
MIFSLCVFLSMLGILNLVGRKTILGCLMGIQFLFMGMSAAFVQIGIRTGEHLQATTMALAICMAGVIQLLIGWALAVVLFRQNQSLKVPAHTNEESL